METYGDNEHWSVKVHDFRITHEPSGDEAEADTRDAAILAARTLIEDNDWRGQCRIWWQGKVTNVVFLENSEPHAFASVVFHPIGLEALELADALERAAERVQSPPDFPSRRPANN